MSAAEQNDEEEINKTDPNPQRLIERVMDKLDLVLVQHGFEFREDMDWTNAGEEIVQWIFKYYDDLTGGDEDYNPGDSGLASDAPEEEEEPSDSATLSSEDEDAEDSPEPAKRAKK